MNIPFGKTAALCAGILSVVVSGAAPMASQSLEMSGPPKVLVIQREYLKPGKAGMTHEKSEAAFVRAMAAANYPTHYFSMDSMSGPSRALYLFPYASFAAWEQDNAMMRKNPTLAAAIDHASLMDGELLTSYDSVAFELREDLTSPGGNLKGARYMEMSLYVVKPGHQAEWEQLAKMYVDGYRKALPEARWAMFQLAYGSPASVSGTTFLVTTPMKSLAERDRGMMENRKLAETLGPDGMKKLGELSAACIASSTTNLFEITPKTSYPPQEWVNEDPTFWKAAPGSGTKAVASATTAKPVVVAAVKKPVVAKP
jgi:hypothetical protein